MAPCESEISPSWSGWGRAVSLAQFLLGVGVGSMPSPQEAPCPPTLRAACMHQPQTRPGPAIEGEKRRSFTPTWPVFSQLIQPAGGSARRPSALCPISLH